MGKAEHEMSRIDRCIACNIGSLGNREGISGENIEGADYADGGIGSAGHRSCRIASLFLIDRRRLEADHGVEGVNRRNAKAGAKNDRRREHDTRSDQTLFRDYGKVQQQDCQHLCAKGYRENLGREIDAEPGEERQCRNSKHRYDAPVHGYHSNIVQHVRREK